MEAPNPPGKDFRAVLSGGKTGLELILFKIFNNFLTNKDLEIRKSWCYFSKPLMGPGMAVYSTIISVKRISK
jgi:hypothetical protein